MNVKRGFQIKNMFSCFGLSELDQMYSRTRFENPHFSLRKCFIYPNCKETKISIQIQI